MRKAVISDASCLIALDNIGELDVLQKVYGQIVTTETVANEFGKPLPNWAKIQNPKDLVLVNVLEASLDEGEASAIALAVEIRDCTLILDDLAARKFAQQMNLELTGTLGVLVRAKNLGVLPALRPVIARLRAVNFRVSERVEREIYAQTGE